MKHTPMPEPLRQAVHQLVSEAVLNCQDVLSYTEPRLAHDWKRMTLYRATDASDTLDMASMLIAAYCQQHTDISPTTLASYLQTRQQYSRAAGPRESDRQEVAGMLGAPAPPDSDAPGQQSYRDGRAYAGNGLMAVPDEQRLFTEACLHGLRARLSDDLDSLDSYLPPQVARLARKVAEALDVPELATT